MQNDASPIEANKTMRSERRSPLTFLSVIALLLSSLLTVIIGLIGLGLFVPNVMAFAPMGDDPAALAVFYFMSAGPVVALLSLIIGWVIYWGVAWRGAGIRIVLLPPIIWAGALLAYLGFVITVCDGEFMCPNLF